MQKLEVVVCMKHSTEMSCEVKLLIKKPMMLKIPTNPKLNDLIATETVLSTVTAELDEYMDLYKERMKTYTQKLENFEKDSMMTYLMVNG